MYQLIYIFYLTAFQLIISSVSQWFSSLFNAENISSIVTRIHIAEIISHII